MNRVSLDADVVLADTQRIYIEQGYLVVNMPDQYLADQPIKWPDSLSEEAEATINRLARFKVVGQASQRDFDQQEERFSDGIRSGDYFPFFYKIEAVPD